MGWREVAWRAGTDLLEHSGERGGEGLAQLGLELVAVGRHLAVALAPQPHVLLELAQPSHGIAESALNKEDPIVHLLWRATRAAFAVAVDIISGVPYNLKARTIRPPVRTRESRDRKRRLKALFSPRLRQPEASCQKQVVAWLPRLGAGVSVAGHDAKSCMERVLVAPLALPPPERARRGKPRVARVVRDPSGVVNDP